MTDISKFIEPKSDRINADDFIGGPETVKISGVKIVTGENPVQVNIEGRKPWYPCKTTMRVMAKAWGVNVQKWAGERLTLYCDPSVTWAGVPVGGIRISHMSGIKGKMTIALTEKRGKRQMVDILPLPDEQKTQQADAATPSTKAQKYRERLEALRGKEASHISECWAKVPAEIQAEIGFAFLGDLLKDAPVQIADADAEVNDLGLFNAQ